jgi:hypothetical protein
MGRPEMPRGVYAPFHDVGAGAALAVRAELRSDVEVAELFCQAHVLGFAT